MAEQFVNAATTTLSSAIISTTATSITVASTLGFPSLTPFHILIDSEFLTVTAISGTTWTVTRQSEDSSRFPAATHAIGATVYFVVTAATLANIVSDALTSSGARTGALITSSGNQSISNNTTTVVNYASTIHADSGYWSAGSPNRLTAPTTGWYLFGSHVQWGNDSGGGRIVEPRINGATYVAKTSLDSSVNWDAPDMVVAWTYYLTAGDYIETTVYQSSGINCNVTNAKLWLRAS